MKSKYNKLTCLFGHHQYSDKLTKDKEGRRIYLCKICKRNALWHWDSRNSNVRVGYDEKGNKTHEKWNDGFEAWSDYNEKGNVIHVKCVDTRNGDEQRWLDNYGNWVYEKPKNWKYDEK